MNLLKVVVLYLTNHPAVKNILNALIHVVMGAVIAYLGVCLGPEHSQAFAWSGLAVAVMGAWKSFIQSNNDLVLAFLQDQMQALGSAGNSAVNVPKPTSTALTPITKMLLFGFLLMALSGPAFCGWELPSQTFGLKSKMPINRFGVAAPTGGNLDGLLVPTASLGIAVDQTVPSYGFNIAYDFVIGGVQATTLTPYLGIGAALYVDMAPWINSNLNNPVEANGGFNVIGPEILGQVPSFQKTWNFQSGEQKTLVMFTVFNGAVPNTTVKVFGN